MPKSFKFYYTVEIFDISLAYLTYNLVNFEKNGNIWRHDVKQFFI